MMWFDPDAKLSEIEVGSTAIPATLAIPLLPNSGIAEIAVQSPSNRVSCCPVAPTLIDQRSDGLSPDKGAYLNYLRIHGPATYGAMATAMGWGATRAWRAEAQLRALGLVRLGEFGRGYPNTTPNLPNDFG
jgi:hypothetical protein